MSDSVLVRIQQEAYMLTLFCIRKNLSYNTRRDWRKRGFENRGDLPINTSPRNSGANSLALETQALKSSDIPRRQSCGAQQHPPPRVSSARLSFSICTVAASAPGSNQSILSITTATVSVPGRQSCNDFVDLVGVNT